MHRVCNLWWPWFQERKIREKARNSVAEKIIKWEEWVGASETRREKSQKRQLWGGKYNRWQHAPLHLNAMHKMICTVYSSIFFSEMEVQRRWKCQEKGSWDKHAGSQWWRKRVPGNVFPCGPVRAKTYALSASPHFSKANVFADRVAINAPTRRVFTKNPISKTSLWVKM